MKRFLIPALLVMSAGVQADTYVKTGPEHGTEKWRPISENDARINSAKRVTTEIIASTDSFSAVERIHDLEAGVTCYVVGGYHAMSCIPDSQLNVSWRKSE